MQGGFFCLAMLTLFCTFAQAQSIELGVAKVLKQLQKLSESNNNDRCISLTDSLIVSVQRAKAPYDTLAYQQAMYIRAVIFRKNKPYQKANESLSLIYEDDRFFRNSPLRDRFRTDVLASHIQILLRDFENARFHLDRANESISFLPDSLLHDLGKYYEMEGLWRLYRLEHDKALEFLTLSKDTYRQNGDTINMDYSSTLYYLGIAHQQMSNYQKSKDELSIAINVAQQCDSLSPTMIGYYSSLGATYTYLNDQSKAFYYNLQAYENGLKHYPVNSFEYIGLVNNIGFMYAIFGKLHQARSYFKKGIDAAQVTLPKNHPAFIQLYSNLVEMDLALDNLDNCLSYINRWDTVAIENFGRESLYQIEISRYRAKSIWKLGDAAKALQEINKAIEIAENNKVQFEIDNISNYGYKSMLLSELGRQREALAEANKEIALLQRVFPDENRKKASAYDHKSLIFQNLGDFEKSLTFNEMALTNTGYDLKLPFIDSLISTNQCLSFLGSRISILKDQYKNTQNKDYLLDAFDVSKATLALCRKIFEGSEREEAKSFVRSSKYQIFEDILEICHLLGQKVINEECHRVAYETIEINKYYKMLHSLDRHGQINYRGVDRVILEEEIFFQNKISATKKALSDLTEDSSPNLSEIKSQTDTLNFYKSKFQALLAELSQSHESYYSLTYGKKEYNLDNLQLALADDEILMNYFMGSEAIYNLVVNKAKIEIQRKPMHDRYRKSINQFLNAIRDPKSNPGEIVEASSYLKKVLLDHDSTHTSKTNKYLIIPDGILNYLPFELLTDEPLLKNNLSYAYSGELYKRWASNKSGRKVSFTGFAPNYTAYRDEVENEIIQYASRAGKLDLPYAKEEIAEIIQIVGGDEYSGDRATKGNFLKIAENLPLVHFAAHTIISDSLPEESGFIFTKDSTDDNILKVSDLYGLDLNMELAVLAGCQTGFGKYRRGEGLLSLASAFSYAGVPSTVFSLWKVPDLSTKMIMVAFYRNLKRGMKKDKALRIAKQNYLDSPIEQELKHPYYWAGFIIQGNTDPIRFTTFGNRIWIRWLIGLIALISVATYFYQRSRGPIIS